tara:strand:+ start:52 stop:375 length:324 start_codon:yes stop_codon:yes gene_type:complete
MRQFDILKEWSEERNLEKALLSVHRDFMFVTDYGLGNIDEWIMHLKTEFNSGTFQFVDPELLIENEEILVWQGKEISNGVKMLSTTSSLIKDKKIWRTMVNKTYLKC